MNFLDNLVGATGRNWVTRDSEVIYVRSLLQVVCLDLEFEPNPFSRSVCRAH